MNCPGKASKSPTECLLSYCSQGMAAALLVGFLGCGSGQGYTPSDSEELIGQAYKAISDNDIPRAVELFEQSIALEPFPYAHYQIAQLLIGQTPDDAAKSIEHCQAGLALEVEGATKADLEWLLAECEKPKGRRFKGANQHPPSQSK